MPQNGIKRSRAHWQRWRFRGIVPIGRFRLQTVFPVVAQLVWLCAKEPNNSLAAVLPTRRKTHLNPVNPRVSITPIVFKRGCTQSLDIFFRFNSGARSMQIRNLFVAIAVSAVIGFVSEQSMAQGPNNLFSQYYTQGPASQAHAAMYPAPNPVPGHVGAAYNTYQPLMPHEHMYAHRRDYYNYYATPDSFYCDACRGPCGRYDGGYGYTKTTVRWQSSCNSVIPLPTTLLPFTGWHKLWQKKRSVPRSLHTCFGGCALKNKLGCKKGCGAVCASGCYPGGYGDGCSDGFCDGNGCADSEYYSNEQSTDFGVTVDDGALTSWSRAGQAAASRTASAMQHRYSR